MGDNVAKRERMTLLAAIVAIASLGSAWWIRKNKEGETKPAKGKLPKLDFGDWIIAFWVIVPPLWFFIEWRSLSYGQELEGFQGTARK